MNRGRICEIGEPNAIYSKPKTRFVADFIGKANLIEGTVTGRRDPLVFVKTSLGEIACETENELDSGRKVTICLRPEFIEVISRKEITNALNTFDGEVESLLFAGEICDVWILSNNVRLRASLMAPAGISEENRIQFHVDPKYCHILSK
jgi:ABC-type Fe3+/spermidine/putrescine transport system ATPase subunit